MNTTSTYTQSTQSFVFKGIFTAISGNSLIQKIPLIEEWERRIIYRSELGRLLDTGSHLVRDMGLGIDEALHEINKPFYIE